MNAKHPHARLILHPRMPPMASTKLLRVNDQPVVLCFIAWMRDYDGVTKDDTPVWDSKRREGGKVPLPKRARATYFLGESSNFTKAHDRDGKARFFGHVQARFNTRRLGGSEEAAEGVTIIWCASDMRDDNKVRVVGWYTNATVFNSEQEFELQLDPKDRRLFPSHNGFNVLASQRDCTLLHVNERPVLPVVPGDSTRSRWHARSKNWYGDESKKLENFLQRAVALDPKIIQPQEADDERKPITKKQIIQTVRDRQGQTEFRNSLLIAYAERCAISDYLTTDLLDACHIYPASRDDATNGLDNGLLLRTDLHTLFDLNLLTVNPRTRTVWISPHVKDAAYRDLHGKRLRRPEAGYADPSDVNLTWHWKRREK